MNKRLKMTALSISLAFAVGSANAGLPVFDYANLAEAILQELNQIEQLGQLNMQTLQQLKDYRLQLQNLQQLKGQVRDEVKQRLQQQLLSNVRDYGRSLMSKSVTADPNAGSYYRLSDDIVSTSIGGVPRSAAETKSNALRVGLSQDSAMTLEASRDRMQYDRVQDNMRQVALTRANAERRAEQANAVTKEMSQLKENNTVGALHVLAAQNSIAYAQGEDSIKTQTTLLQNMEEQRTRLLTERRGPEAGARPVGKS
ncbi:hypothetical protein ACHMW6_00170 (plasmid) [Pseudoduganella sp. UC29_106]|uniref:hypothetical protein n=1 Tax=Pseudoduganella sp. UC29_106 TaxID=3374553 RepID=UPI0037579863